MEITALQGAHPANPDGQTLAILDLVGTLGDSTVGDISDFTLFDYSLEALRLLSSLGMGIIIITNHSRIARGLLSLDEFHEKKTSLIRVLEQAGIHVAAFLLCPHAKDAGCDCRKPQTGLIDRFLDGRTNVDLSRSYVIGDMVESDVLLARNLGARGILVKTGCGLDSLAAIQCGRIICSPYSVQATVLDAARLIRDNKAR